MMYQNGLATPILPGHTATILEILDETLLPKGYSKIPSRNCTDYSPNHIKPFLDGNHVTVLHEPSLRGDVMIAVYGSPFGSKTRTELLKRLIVRGLRIEKGQYISGSGVIYLVSKK